MAHGFGVQGDTDGLWEIGTLGEKNIEGKADCKEAMVLNGGMLAPKPTHLFEPVGLA